jgi:PTH1 family peptidyl-tRNA hydrolase
MNLSGDSVYLVKNFYKIETEDILVIYDDLDLETGKIRIRPNGSSGGHKGIQSIINNLGTKEVKRVRIGIDKVSSDKTIDYVIGNFSKQDREIINISIEKGYDILLDFIKLPFEQVMSRYN